MSDWPSIKDLAEDWDVLRPKPGGRGRASYLIDQRFGRLLVLERAGSDKRGKSLWRCGCDCGNEVLVPRGNLVRGRVKSCGCLQAEYRKSSKPEVMQAARDARRRRPDFLNEGVQDGDTVTDTESGQVSRRRSRPTPGATVEEALDFLENRNSD